MRLTEDIVVKYLVEKSFKILSLYIFDDISWQSTGLTLNGNGCYYIAIGRFFKNQVSSNIMYFDKLNKSNILESITQ